MLATRLHARAIGAGAATFGPGADHEAHALPETAIRTGDATHELVLRQARGSGDFASEGLVDGVGDDNNSGVGACTGHAGASVTSTTTPTATRSSRRADAPRGLECPG